MGGAEPPVCQGRIPDTDVSRRNRVSLALNIPIFLFSIYTFPPSISLSFLLIIVTEIRGHMAGSSFLFPPPMSTTAMIFSR